MRTKRVLSLLLTCAVLCGMLVLPTAADTASTASTTFTDIADPEVAGAAAVSYTHLTLPTIA